MREFPFTLASVEIIVWTHLRTTFSCVNAGNNSPHVMPRRGVHESFDAGATILGTLAGSLNEHCETVPVLGDQVALPRYGMTEDTDGTGEPWGEDRAVAPLRAGARRPCPEAVTPIAGPVPAFGDGAGATDDMTLPLARLTGAP